MNTGKTYVIVTVDTEAYSVGGKTPTFDQHIYGTIDGEQYGVTKIMEICDTYKVSATFFVDFCMHHKYGESTLKGLCKIIDTKGHDVQVHAHPNLIPGYKPTTKLHSCSFDIQDRILCEAKQLYEKWFERPPLAFRAGSYGANMDTIRALEKNGYKLDSSYFQFNKDCVLSSELSHHYANKMFFIGKVLELPVTVYSMVAGLYNKNSKVDMNACSWSEIKYVLHDYIREPRISFVIMFLHSFSFIRQGKKVGDISPNFGVARKFENTLQFLEKDNRVEMINISSFYKILLGVKQDLTNIDDYIGTVSLWTLVPRVLERLFR